MAMDLDLDRWTRDRLATLTPTWQPDVARGRALMHARTRRRPQPARWLIAAVATVTAAVLIMLPQTRSWAQELWARFFLKVDVVRVDFDNWPLEPDVTMRGGQQAAADLTTAEANVGFTPVLPPDDVVGGHATLSTIGVISVSQTVQVRDLQLALDRAGVTDVRVPVAWNGVQLRADIGPILAADYPNDVQILQARPISLVVPATFPLSSFAEVAFRAMTLSPSDARALARQFVATPSFLLGIPPDETATVEPLNLRNGPALLVEEFDDNNPNRIQRVTVIRNTTDRVFAVTARDREVAARIAESLR
jgi:hypothetical protein